MGEWVSGRYSVVLTRGFLARPKLGQFLIKLFLKGEVGSSNASFPRVPHPTNDLHLLLDSTEYVP